MVSSSAYGAIGPYCEILGRLFDENGQGYARYAGTNFPNVVPARFSFDFAVRPKVLDGLILLYGKTSPPIGDFFWVAIDIYNSKLRFQFRNLPFILHGTDLNSSMWYHIECQVSNRHRSFRLLFFYFNF